MKISFNHNEYVEVTRMPNSEKIFLTIAAHHAENKRSLIINSAELTREQFLTLFKSINI